jgi:hypothetical protein
MFTDALEILMPVIGTTVRDATLSMLRATYFTIVVLLARWCAKSLRLDSGIIVGSYTPLSLPASFALPASFSFQMLIDIASG